MTIIREHPVNLALSVQCATPTHHLNFPWLNCSRHFFPFYLFTFFLFCFVFFQISLLSLKHLETVVCFVEKVIHPARTSQSDPRKHASVLSHLIARFRTAARGPMRPQRDRAPPRAAFTELHCMRMQCYPDTEGIVCKVDIPPTELLRRCVTREPLCAQLKRSVSSKQRRRNMSPSLFCSL